MAGKFSRRSIVKRAAAIGAASAIPARVLGQSSSDPGYRNLSSEEAATLEAIVSRLIPSDDSGPGALEAGAATYIDRALGDALIGERDAYARGLAALQRYAEETFGLPFARLTPDQQDAALAALEQNRAAGFESDSASFFDLVLAHTLQGTFSDPHYGGNRDFIGWELIAYPGLRLAVAPGEQAMNAALEPTEISAYDLPMFDEDEP